ncbi:MAG: hypothetical protein QXN36_05480 [Candidatus Bathyarchaeia archaeon]
MKRPIGVTIVAWLTFLSGIALLFILILFWVVAVVGGPYSSGASPYLSPIFYAPLVLAAFAFSVSFMMLVRARYAWHSSMIFWIVFVLFFIWYYSFMGVWRYMLYLESGDSWYQYLSIARILFLPFPFVYAIGCSIYFLTRTPKEHFLREATT